MKSMRESQISHLCVDSILSWIGTDGQCLAALHIHISALEPDQLTQPCLRDVDWSCQSLPLYEKSANNPKPPSVIDDHRSHTQRRLIITRIRTMAVWSEGVG